ncbi:DUF6283 family protein [Streptomyces olivaceoviridis]|uniref:DUF6283 family protein n=1 Tax=Streptomyces olivaceoviridis TaxID=1921 RepID=UPI003333B627
MNPRDVAGETPGTQEPAGTARPEGATGRTGTRPEPLPTGPAAGEPSGGQGPKPGPGPATVLWQRPGDEEWGVESLVPAEPAAQPRPCSGRQVCPWRRDAPAGQFPPQVYVHSAPGNRLGGPAGWFGCHSSTAVRPLLCAGWLLAGADGNDAALEMIRTGALPRPELPDGVQLYNSYAEMAIANGVDPGLPALYERSAGQPADFVPLQDLADHDRDDENDGTYEDGWVQSLVRELKRSMPPDALLGLVLAADDAVLQLGFLRVSIGHRGEGHATRVLARVCAEADARGLVVACTPTDEFGADRARLEGFYRRFGFAPAAPADRLTEHTWQRPAARPAPGGGPA